MCFWGSVNFLPKINVFMCFFPGLYPSQLGDKKTCENTRFWQYSDAEPCVFTAVFGCGFSPHGSCSSFYCFFVSFFQTSFLTAIKPESSQNESSQTTKNQKKLQKKVTETHPQSGPVKRLSLAGARPWNWQPLQHFQLFSQRPGALKVEPKWKPKWVLGHPKSWKIWNTSTSKNS